MNDDQSTNDSFVNSSANEEIVNKPIDDKKNDAIVSSDNEVSLKSENDVKEEHNEDYSPEPKGVPPPELIDESTVENKCVDEEIIDEDLNSSFKNEPIIDESHNRFNDSETDESVTHLNETKDEIEVKVEDQSPVKDAFDFDEEEEMVKEEEPLKEQLKKKRKAKDDNRKSKAIDKNDKNKDNIEDNNKEIEKSMSFTRKNSKKLRKSVIETPEKITPEVKEVVKEVEEVPKVVAIKEEEEKKSKKSLSLSLPSTESNQKQETKKRKGRKKKDEESVSPVKKKIKPNKLEIPEEDSNLEIQKLFENSTPTQDEVLPQFTTDINPSQQDSVSSDFLLCEEAVPASPEKETTPEEQHEDSSPIQESPQSFHSSPTQSPEDVTIKDSVLKSSGGSSNSELENEPIVMKDDSMKMETLPSPVHDDDSIISRPDCSKSPISPKKRRRGRMRTTSQSDSSHHPKERIGCKTRGSSGN
jgi:hypothetical protein